MSLKGSFLLSAFPLHLLIALAKGVYSGVEVFFSCIKSLYIFLWNLEYYGFLESGPKNRQTIQFLKKWWSLPILVCRCCCKYPKFWRKIVWRHLVFAFSKKPIRDSNFSTILLVMSFLVVFLLTYLFFSSCLCLHWRNERHFLEKKKYLSVLHQTHTTLESRSNNINADI